MGKALLADDDQSHLDTFAVSVAMINFPVTFKESWVHNV